MVYKYEKLGEELIKLLKQRKKNGEKFCKKCSLYDENKCSRRVGQNAPKYGISRQFERRKNNDSSTFRMPRHYLSKILKNLDFTVYF